MTDFTDDELSDSSECVIVLQEHLSEWLAWMQRMRELCEEREDSEELSECIKESTAQDYAFHYDKMVSNLEPLLVHAKPQEYEMILTAVYSAYGMGLHGADISDRIGKIPARAAQREVGKGNANSTRYVKTRTHAKQMFDSNEDVKAADIAHEAAELGYEVPTPRAIRNWLKKWRK